MNIALHIINIGKPSHFKGMGTLGYSSQQYLLYHTLLPAVRFLVLQAWQILESVLAGDQVCVVISDWTLDGSVGGKTDSIVHLCAHI